jgi:hypothetical protein
LDAPVFAGFVPHKGTGKQPANRRKGKLVFRVDKLASINSSAEGTTKAAFTEKKPFGYYDSQTAISGSSFSTQQGIAPAVLKPTKGVFSRWSFMN